MAGSQRLTSTTGDSGDIQTLLKAAELHGGSLAEVAYELQNPHESFWQKTTGIASGAFKYTMKALNLGLNTVAGAASAEYSIKEAIKENIMPSDLLFGEDETLGDHWYSPENILDGVRRFTVDTLTDPLTYASLGVAPLAKVVAKGATLTKLGIKEGAEITVSKTGQKLINKFQVSKFNALKGDFLKKEASLFEKAQLKKGIKATDEEIAKHLDDVSKSTPDAKILEGFMSKEDLALHTKKTFANMLETNTVRREYLEQSYKKIVADASKEGVQLTDDELRKRIMALSNSKTESQIADELLNAKLSPEFVQQTISNLMKLEPNYLKTLVDQGGIKAFGKTVLSGQRIRTSLNALPLVSTLDEITKSTRNLIGRAFNTSYTKEGKVSETEMAFMQKHFDMSSSQTAEVANKFINFSKAMNLNDNEMDMILAAREAFEVGDLAPIDPITREAYNLLTGKPVDYSILPENIAKATGFLDKQFKDNLDKLRSANKKVQNIKGYIPRLLVQTEATRAHGVAKSLFRQKELKSRGIGAFTDDQGNRIYGHIEDMIDETGTTSVIRDKEGKIILKLKKHNQDLARKAIQEKVDEAITTGYNQVDELQSEIGGLVDDLQEVFDDKALKSFRKHIEKIPGMDATTKKYLLSAIKDKTEKLDIDNMIMNRLEGSYADGVKIKAQLKELSQDELDAMKERIASKTDIDPQAIEKFNTSLNKIIEGKKKVKAPVEGEVPEKVTTLKEIEDELRGTKDAFDARQKALLESGLDSNKISEILTTLKTDFENTIPGSARKLDQIIAKKQAIKSIISDVEMDRMSGIKNFQDVDKIKEGTFIDPINEKYYTRNQAKFEEARQLGVDFETNVMSVALQNSQEAIHISTATKMLDGLSKNFGRLKSEAPEGWRPIDLSTLSEKQMDFGDFATGKNGEPILFHPATAAKVEDYLKAMGGDETTNEILKKYDKLQNITKASLTTIFPMFHGRNAISNAFLNHLNLGAQSLNPVLHVAAGSFMKREAEFSKLMKAFDANLGSKEGTDAFAKFTKAKEGLDALKKQVVFVDKNGYRWSFGEMRNTVSDRLIAFNPGITGQFDINKSQQENLQELLYSQMPSKTLKEKGAKKLKQLKDLDQNLVPGNKAGRWVAQNIEDHARLVSFFGNLKDTGDIELAAAKTKQFLFDYTNLTQFEKKFLRRVMPFYTFARKNFELQTKMLFKEPGKIAQQIRAVKTVGSMISGQQPLTDEERAMLPEWMQNTIAPLKSRQGSKIQIYKGVQLPIEALYEQSTPKGIINMVSPLIKYPFENITGYSVYNGKPISDMTKADAYAKAPKVLQDFVGLEKVTIDTKDGPVVSYRSMRPERMYALSNIPITSRVAGIFNKVGDGQSWDANRSALYTLTGIDVQDYDLELEAARKEKETKARLEKALNDAGLGYKFSRFTLKKD